MASPGIISQLLHELAVGIGEVRWVNCALVAGVTLFVYDWLLTLDLEVSLVWNSPWNITKLVFLLNRYLLFIDITLQTCFQFGYALPQHVCKVLFNIPAWSYLIGHSFAILILTMRTWAFCGRGKLMSYGLFGTFGAIVIAACVLAELYLKSSTFKVSPIPELLGCIVEAKSSYLALLYVLLIFYEGSLLVLMIARGVSVFRTAGTSKLTRVVYWDGVLYYIYMFGLSLVNIVIIFRLQGAFSLLLVAIERVAYSVLACRVVLHIREQGRTEESLFLQSEQQIRFGPTQRIGQVAAEVSEESSSRV